MLFPENDSVFNRIFDSVLLISACVFYLLVSGFLLLRVYSGDVVPAR